MCCISSCKSAMTYNRYISRNLLISLFLSPATKFPSKISLVTFSLQKELMTIIAFSKDSSSKILSYISYRIVSAMRKTTGDPFTKNKSHTKYSVSRGNSPTKSTMSHLNIFWTNNMFVSGFSSKNAQSFGNFSRIRCYRTF